MAVIIVLFYVDIFQNSENRALWLIENVCLPRQELSNEQTMSSVQPFCRFDPNAGVTDLFGGRGNQISNLSHQIWSACFWMAGNLIFACQSAPPNPKVFLGQPSSQVAGYLAGRNSYNNCSIRKAINSKKMEIFLEALITTAEELNYP